jgi:hypothetical protein
MTVSEARRMKELEQENAKPKRLLAEAELDKAALKDLLGRKWWARQRLDALGAQIGAIKLADKTPNARKPLVRKTRRDHAHDRSANTMRRYQSGANRAYSEVTSK